MQETLPQPTAGLAITNKKRALWLLVAAAALALAVIASLVVGSKNISPSDVFHALWHPEASNDGFIVMELRVPRTLLGLVVGTALGLAGALIQAFTRNPLADPGILGVNAGAGFAVVLGVAFFGVVRIQDYIWFSFAGAVLATVAVYVIGSRGRGAATPIRLTMVGIALGAVLGGISSGITLLMPEVFNSMRFWGAGTLANRSWDMLWTVLPFMAVGIALSLAVARPLNAVALGADLATSLGAHLGRTRIVVVIAVTLLCGAATAAAGPIGFVGLMIPHISRWLVGPDQRWIMAYTAILAPLLLLAADIAGRLVLRPDELQVGIVTALIGAPVLIYLVRSKKVSGL